MAKPSNKSDDKMPKKRGRKPKEAVQGEPQRAPAMDYVSSDELGANGEINGNVAVPAAIPAPPVVEEEDFTPAPVAPAPVVTAAPVPVAEPEDTEAGEKPTDESIHAKYERIKKGNLHLTDLQNLDVVELHNIARRKALPNTWA